MCTLASRTYILSACSFQFIIMLYFNWVKEKKRKYRKKIRKYIATQKIVLVVCFFCGLLNPREYEWLQLIAPIIMAYCLLLIPVFPARLYILSMRLHLCAWIFFFFSPLQIKIKTEWIREIWNNMKIKKNEQQPLSKNCYLLIYECILSFSATSMHFFFLAAFFWLNVMCLNIYLTFR